MEEEQRYYPDEEAREHDSLFPAAVQLDLDGPKDSVIGSSLQLTAPWHQTPIAPSYDAQSRLQSHGIVEIDRNRRQGG